MYELHICNKYIYIYIPTNIVSIYHYNIPTNIFQRKDIALPIYL